MNLDAMTELKNREFISKKGVFFPLCILKFFTNHSYE